MELSVVSLGSNGNNTCTNDLTISQCLSLTIQAMQRVDLEKPDRRRPDENGRRFRFVDIVDPTMVGYILRVSIKYVRQNDGLWIKFYQSCWHQRSL